jgi:hypothetical protein
MKLARLTDTGRITYVAATTCGPTRVARPRRTIGGWV